MEIDPGPNPRVECAQCAGGINPTFEDARAQTDLFFRFPYYMSLASCHYSPPTLTGSKWQLPAFRFRSSRHG